jgi:hypothetical protein
MEPAWWDKEELKHADGFVQTLTEGYLDYSKDVSVTEMRELHDVFRPAAHTGVYADSTWQEIIRPELQLLDDALYDRPDDFSHFRVTVFEW